MKIRLTSLVAAAIFALIAPAQAATYANAQRLTAVMGLEDAVEKAIGDAVSSVRTQLAGQGMAPEKIDEFAAAFRDELDAGSSDLVAQLTRAYADRFTDAEINDLVDFYGSPTGRKLVAVQTELAQEQAYAVLRWIAAAAQRAGARLDGAAASV